MLIYFHPLLHPTLRMIKAFLALKIFEKCNARILRFVNFITTRLTRYFFNLKCVKKFLEKLNV